MAHSTSWRFRSARGGVAGALAGVLAGCGGGPTNPCADAPGDPSAGTTRNVLVVVGDDIGVDKLGVYEAHPFPARTPNLDALAADGLRFTNAWSAPTCSPSRAALLTGRMPSRTGVGRWIAPGGDARDLPLDERLLPEVLSAGPYGYTSAAVGKWHLVRFGRDEPALHPLRQGFGCYAGSLANPRNSLIDPPSALSHFFWEKAENGETSWSDTYMVTDTTDEALGLLATLPSPWLLYVAYNGAHTPVHAPPAELLSTPVADDADELTLYEAMVEATDAEIGRLLAGMSSEQRAETTMIYVSDNGTPDHGVAPPADPGRAKGSVYEGGVRVPLIVTGPLVTTPGATSDALVHITDLFATIAEIGGVNPQALLDGSGRPLPVDGRSLLPQLADPDAPSPRPYLFTEGFYPNGAGPYAWRRRAVRDAEWKLTRVEDDGEVTEELFRYEPGAPDEGADHLLDGLDAEEAAVATRLRDALATITADLGAP